MAQTYPQIQKLISTQYTRDIYRDLYVDNMIPADFCNTQYVKEAGKVTFDYTGSLTTNEVQPNDKTRYQDISARREEVVVGEHVAVAKFSEAVMLKIPYSPLPTAKIVLTEALKNTKDYLQIRAINDAFIAGKIKKVDINVGGANSALNDDKLLAAYAMLAEKGARKDIRMLLNTKNQLAFNNIGVKGGDYALAGIADRQKASNGMVVQRYGVEQIIVDPFIASENVNCRLHEDNTKSYVFVVAGRGVFSPIGYAMVKNIELKLRELTDLNLEYAIYAKLIGGAGVINPDAIIAIECKK